MPLSDVCAFQEGAVDAAKARGSREWCADGLGTTFKFSELEEADEAGRIEEFMEHHAACLKSGGPNLALVASCTPVVDFPISDSRGIFCAVAGFSSDELSEFSLNMSQFRLAANDRMFVPDPDLIASNPIIDDLANGPVTVKPGEFWRGYIAFHVPKEYESEDLLLTWNVPVDDFGGGDTLEILVEGRDNALALLLSAAATAEEPTVSAPDAASGGEVITSLDGVTDSVSDPVFLAAGRYRVTSLYLGSSNFIVWVHYSSGESDLLFNEMGSYNGQATFNLGSDAKVVFEIQGQGKWIVEVRPAF
jgi:hypothetical protein